MAYVIKFEDGVKLSPIDFKGTYTNGLSDIRTIRDAIVCGFINDVYVGLPAGQHRDLDGNTWNITVYDSQKYATVAVNGNVWKGTTPGGLYPSQLSSSCVIASFNSEPYTDLPIRQFTLHFSETRWGWNENGDQNVEGNYYNGFARVATVPPHGFDADIASHQYYNCVDCQSSRAVRLAIKTMSGMVGFPYYVQSTTSTNIILGESLDNPDPYGEGEEPDPGGGGEQNPDSDDIDEPDLPDIGAIATGLITVFRPSIEQLRNLSKYFWADNIITYLQGRIEGIADMFVGLGIVPINVPAGNTVEVSWFGLTTGVNLTLCGQQYFTVNCGTIDVDEFWGSALDYSPYTSIQIYLPFIGSKSLDVDEVMGKTLGVKYHIDIASGTCVAFITVNGSVMYQFTGNVITEIPITSVNYDAIITNATNMALAAAGYHAASGAHTEAQHALESASNPAEVKSAEGKVRSTNSTLQAKGQQLIGSAVSAVMGSKPHFEKTGSIAASAGMLAVRTPYITINRPRMSRPAHYNHYVGLPCNKEVDLFTLTGFTVIEDVRLNDLVATSGEIAEIYELLRKGVIL